jgi:hypothetical protein
MRVQLGRNRTMRHSQLLMLVMLLLMAAASVTIAQSNDRDNPTPVSSNTIKGAGVGRKVEYYYSFSAGPGEVVLTIDLKAKSGSTGADVEVFDAGSNKIFYFFPKATRNNERAVKRFRVAHKETVVLRLAFDLNAGDYTIKLGGSVELAAIDSPARGVKPPPASLTDKVKQSNENNNRVLLPPGSDGTSQLPDLVIDRFEVTDPSRGELKIQVRNKGGGNAGTSTLRLIVWKAAKPAQKEVATVFAKVPALASGQTTSIVVMAGVAIRKRKHSLYMDISEDIK